jgi:hypothetical protein
MQSPMMLISAHVDQPNGTTPEGPVISILVHYCIVGMRVEDARADVVLGARILAAARMGLCPYFTGDHGAGHDHHPVGSCKHHYRLGTIIVCAACLDIILEILWFRAFHLWFRPDQIRRATVGAHMGMFLCEASIFVCALYATIHGMFAFSTWGDMSSMSHSVQSEGVDDRGGEVFLSAKGYAIMCTCTTMLAMVYIILLIAIPENAWKALEEFGMKDIVSKFVSRSARSSRVAPLATSDPDSFRQAIAKMQGADLEQDLVKIS